MKFFKRFFLFVILFSFSIIVFKGFLFRNFVKYNDVGARGIFVIEDFNKDKLKSDNMDEIINHSLEKTSEKLEFKLKNTGNFLLTGKANCIGYSDFFSASINQFLINNNLQNDWKVSHKIGKLEVLGIDIHQYFGSPFFKDHDFVVIENLKTKEKIAVDPTIYDYLKINRISLKQ